MSELDTFLDRMTALLSIGSGPLTAQGLQSIIAKARETEPAAHWSPWLEWRGGPCPLPGDVPVDTRSRRDIEEYVYRAGKIYWGHDNPAGWLPRGKFVPPAELWAEGCPVRVEFAEQKGDKFECGIPRGSGTHIRLVARQPQAGLPEFVQIDTAGDYAIKVGSGRVLTCSSTSISPDDLDVIGDTFHILAARERARRAG